MQLRFLVKTLALIMLVFLLGNTLVIPSALAGRSVLNQNSDVIIQNFGEPLERIFAKDVDVYAYDTPELHRLFPQFPNSKFFITFIARKANSITVDFKGDFDSYPEDNYDKDTAFKFFNYIFGYEPPVWKELSSKFTGNETIYDYVYCLGDGVATSFTRYGYKQVTDYAILYYDKRCEDD